MSDGPQAQTLSPPVHDSHHRQVSDCASLWGLIPRVWRLLPSAIQLNFLPEDLGKIGEEGAHDQKLPNEQVQLEIRQAWYRDILGLIVLDWLCYFVIAALIISAIVGIVGFFRQWSPWVILLPFVALGVLAYYAAYERVRHMQWRLLKTNARVIISLPENEESFLVDSIELKGLPNVIDTNWSKSPILRLFQIFTGARDLYISLAGYQFTEHSARVRDALVMPDVMPADVRRLKELVFAVPGGGPQAVKFISPQEVIITERQNH